MSNSHHNPRWAPYLGGPVLSSSQHGQDLALRVCDAVRRRGASEISDVIASVLVPALGEAYEAGVREGRERAAHDLSDTVERLVERALAGIQIPGGSCPHCAGGRTDYGECAECSGTGRYRAPK